MLRTRCSGSEFGWRPLHGLPRPHTRCLFPPAEPRMIATWRTERQSGIVCRSRRSALSRSWAANTRSGSRESRYLGTFRPARRYRMASVANHRSRSAGKDAKAKWTTNLTVQSLLVDVVTCTSPPEVITVSVVVVSPGVPARYEVMTDPRNPPKNAATSIPAMIPPVFLFMSISRPGLQ